MIFLYTEFFFLNQVLYTLFRRMIPLHNDMNYLSVWLKKKTQLPFELWPFTLAGTQSQFTESWLHRVSHYKINFSEKKPRFWYCFFCIFLKSYVAIFKIYTALWATIFTSVCNLSLKLCKLTLFPMGLQNCGVLPKYSFTYIPNSNKLT